MVTNEHEFSKMIALFFVQLIGVTIVGITLRKIKSFTSITSRQEKVMWYIVVIAGALTIILCLLQRQLLSGILSLIKSEWGQIDCLSFVTFSFVISFYAFMDLLGLAVLIYLTGGSSRSMYIPYLLIIVPMMIALEADPIIASGCFGLSILVFLVCLWRQDEPFTVTQQKIYNRYFAGIVFFCVFFPTALMLLIMWYDAK